MGKPVPLHDPAFMERAWASIARAAGKANIAVILGTERMIAGGLAITALVINKDGISFVSRTR